MRRTIVNRCLITALVASAAFALSGQFALAADEPTAEPAQPAVVLASVQPSAVVDAAAASSPAPELTQLSRPVPHLLPPPVVYPSAPPAIFRPASPVVVQPAQVRRVVRRAPARTAPPFVRVSRSEPPPRSFALFGVGFGF